MFNWLYEFVADEFLVVALPRELVLKNRRLGAFYKCMQFCCLIVCILYAVSANFFLKPHSPTPWGVNIWHEEGTTVGSSAVPAYCKDPAAYAHRQTNTGVSYEPTACKALPSQEAAAATDGNGRLFLATFVDDVILWEGMGSDCGAAARVACINRVGSTVPVYKEVVGSNRCSCSLQEQFLVQNPEDQRIGLAYGYEVDLSHGKRKDVLRGGILASATSNGPQHKPKEKPSHLTTTFLAPNGKTCEFGGKSEWKHSDSIGGISGTLGELLNCAGVTLDSNPATLVPGTLPAPPHLRTMGLRIDLHLEFVQKVFGGVKVYIRAVPVPVATVMRSSDVKLSNFPTTNASAVSRNLRRVHGVAVSMPVMTGGILKFSWFHVLSGVVDIAVVGQIPRILVHFIAMYLLGVTSEVYRSTARAKLNIFNQFHTTVANLMLSEVAFRGLVRDWNSPFAELGGFTPKRLLLRLRDILQEEIGSGVLQDAEIEQMAKVIFMVMDRNHSGEISCSEFIEACTEHCDMNMRRLAKFFDEDTRIGGLSFLLDDTHHEKKKARRRSTEGDTCVDFGDMDDNGQAEANTQRESPIESPKEVVDTNCGTLRACGLNVSLCSPDVAKLEHRVQDLERHCEQALEALRTLATQYSQLGHRTSVASDTQAIPRPSSPAQNNTDQHQAASVLTGLRQGATRRYTATLEGLPRLETKPNLPLHSDLQVPSEAVHSSNVAREPVLVALAQYGEWHNNGSRSQASNGSRSQAPWSLLGADL